MIKAIRSIFVLAALFACSSYVVIAQTTGTISGDVRDEKEAVIPKATVTVRNVRTNDLRTAQTDDDGRYRFTNMPVGDYEVTVESTGFAKHIQSGITLALNQNAVVNVAMKAGGVQETVNVVENAAVLNTSNAESVHASTNGGSQSYQLALPAMSLTLRCPRLESASLDQVRPASPTASAFRLTAAASARTIL